MRPRRWVTIPLEPDDSERLLFFVLDVVQQ